MVLVVHILVGYLDMGEARYDTAASGRLINCVFCWKSCRYLQNERLNFRSTFRFTVFC